MPLRGALVEVERGVTREYRITQFADDTQIILRGYRDLYRMWELLQEYENASGMRANKKKFEGVRCGRLRKEPPPTLPGLHACRFAMSTSR